MENGRQKRLRNYLSNKIKVEIKNGRQYIERKQTEKKKEKKTYIQGEREGEQSKLREYKD